MALPSSQAYPLYILLSADSDSHNRILKGYWGATPSAPLVKYTSQTLKMALCDVLEQVGDVYGADLSDENTDNMLAADCTADLTPGNVRSSFKVLSRYSMGSCPKGHDETTLWSLIANAPQPLVLGNLHKLNGPEDTNDKRR